MEKATFYAVTITDGINNYSYAFRVRNSENLWSPLEAITQRAKILYMNACDSKKYAVDIARDWNQVWADKGILWADAPILACVVW